MKVGVLVNPAARRNRKNQGSLKQIATAQPDALFEQLDRFADLPDILERFVTAEAPAILISGGDGTVQAVQTWLAENLAPDRLPRLALLPDGTTNMDAADVGVQNPRSRSVIERLMVPEYCLRSTHIKRRHTLRIANPADEAPQHGMFFGLGAIQRAVIMCQQDIHKLGFSGEIANGLTLLRALSRTLFLGEKDKDPDRIYQPTPVVVHADDSRFTEDGQLFVLVTTLHRLVLGARPFWSQTEEALKTTAASFPVNRLLRSVIPVMYARNDRPPSNAAFRSTSAHRLALDTEAPFILDGEPFDAPTDGPLTISLGPAFDFICG